MSTSPRDRSNAALERTTETAHRPDVEAARALWTVVKAGGRCRAELLGHGEYGWELQLLRDEEFRYGRRHQLRALAIAEGDPWRELETKGWSAVSGA